MNAYSTILFDADGTLFDYDRAEAFALEHACGEYGIPISRAFADAYRAINSELWRQHESGLLTLEEVQSERFARLFTAGGIEGVDPVNFNRDYVRYLGQGAFLIDSALETCELLEMSCTLAIITNGLKASQTNRLRASELDPYISYLITSEEVGVSKPDGAYFDAAFERCGNPPRNRVLIVGDNLRADIRGGYDYGVDTCWYNPDGLINDTPVEPTYEIEHLLELPEIVLEGYEPEDEDD